MEIETAKRKLKLLQWSIDALEEQIKTGLEVRETMREGLKILLRKSAELEGFLAKEGEKIAA